MVKLQKIPGIKNPWTYVFHPPFVKYPSISTPKKSHENHLMSLMTPPSHQVTPVIPIFPFLVASALSIFAQDSRRQQRLLASSKVTSSVTWPWDLELTKTKKPTTWVVLEYRNRGEGKHIPFKGSLGKWVSLGICSFARRVSWNRMIRKWENPFSRKEKWMNLM